MATEQIRTIRCGACGHDYEITRVMTIDGNAVRIDDPSLWATAYCPNCGQPAQVLLQEVGDADG
jgi:transcription elongation factor Elf1